MIRRTIPLMLLTSCLHMIQTGDPYPTDTQCEPVRGVSVVLREGVQTWPAILTCEQARSRVSEALGRYSLHGWIVYLTMGVVGLDTDGDQVIYPHAVTIGTKRAIECEAMATGWLRHEFGHAWDIENHQPNKRDRR